MALCFRHMWPVGVSGGVPTIGMFGQTKLKTTFRDSFARPALICRRRTKSGGISRRPGRTIFPPSPCPAVRVRLRRSHRNGIAPRRPSAAKSLKIEHELRRYDRMLVCQSRLCFTLMTALRRDVSRDRLREEPSELERFSNTLNGVPSSAEHLLSASPSL